MSQAIPHQHPAVVLRSHYRHLRTLLAIAMVAVVGLSTAVVILATDDDTGASTSSSLSEPQPATAQQLHGTPFRGGSDESSVAQGISRQPAPMTTARPDESAVAQSLSRTPTSPMTAARPDESAVAQSLAPTPTSTATPDRAKAAATETFLRRTAPEPTRPDESGVATAISGR